MNSGSVELTGRAASHDGRRSRIAAAPRSRTIRSQQAAWGFAMVAPVLLVFFLTRILPAFYAFYISLTSYPLLSQPVWVGIDNYVDLLSDPYVLDAFRITIIYAVCTIVPSIVLALLLALVLNNRLHGITLFRTALYMPQVISLVSVGMIWMMILNPSFGAANQVMGYFGLPEIGWLSDPDTALLSVILIGIWRNVGYAVVIYLAGLQSIPKELYEAAHVDGANMLKRTWFITIPLLKQTTVFIVVVTTIIALQTFDQVFVLTAGGPADATTTAVVHIYRLAFERYEMGYASAVAFLLFVTILIIALGFLFFTGQFRKDGDQ
jgi:ABC-type sugar transport system permease subunit